MEYGNQISKDTLRQLLDATPNIPQNQQVRDTYVRLLTQKTVQAIPYTYNAVYWLTGANSALAAGVLNVPFNINIQSDADFLILNQTYASNSANAAVTSGTFTYPNIIVTLTDTGSGYALMDQGVPVTSIFGNGQFPYILPQPKMMPAKSTLQVLVSNLDNAANYNLRLAFSGVKLYSYN